MDAGALFEAQRRLVPARRTGFGLAERRDALDRLRAMLCAHEAEIIAAIAADFGKAATETRLSEILPVLQEIAHARRHLRRWMRPRRVWPSLTTFGTSGRVIAEPRGVALIIGPWNYPLLLTLGPLVSALAAGNAVILKPSEKTPATSALIARMIGATFPPDLVAVVEGGVPETTGLLALPFDHIFFTGSPAVGRVVMAAAARTLASVTLELGGRSPAIVTEGADIAQAARWIAWGKFLNAGQTCVAPDHVYVHEDLAPRLIAALRAEIRRAYGPDPRQSPDLARIVSAADWARLAGLVEDARAGGAEVLEGGLSDAATRYVAPTLIAGATPDMALLRTEIFGPVLPILTFRDLAEPVAAINAGERPLALYVFGDRAVARRVVEATSSGSVGINLTVAPFVHPNLPFGGIGHSGLGAAHGEAGFRAFSHEKPVLANRFSMLPLVFPPYGRRVRGLVAGLLRLF